MRKVDTAARLNNATISGRRSNWLVIFCLGLCAVAPAAVGAAGYEFLALESVYDKLPQDRQIHRRAIVVTSSRRRIERLPQNTRTALKDYFVYQTRVRVDGATYYRLAIGNFSNPDQAQKQLELLRPIFASAWIYQRNEPERQALADYLQKQSSNAQTNARSRVAETAEDQLTMAREAFLDQNFPRAVSLANRVVQHGNNEQTQIALELAGAAQEKQGRYAQAMTLYETLLNTDPPEEMAARIESRMEGIRTMSIEPKAKLQVSEKKSDDDWIARGVLQQYYRDDVLERPGEGSESVNQMFATDVDLKLQRRTEANSLLVEIDAGLVADLTDDNIDSRVSRASVSYTTDDYRLIGGRQHRTVKGVFGRLDGFTYVDLARSGFQPSYFIGTVAQSTSDGLETERPLLGLNLDFSPYAWLDVSLYLVSQEISGLTDRQAVGSEFQLRNNRGFIYGIVDYDFFYQDLNNVSLISSYRRNQQWTFNLTLDRTNSPFVSTINALQGQAVNTIQDLNNIFTDDQVYQLAQDRTGNSQSLYFSSIYTIDTDRQLYLGISLFELDEIPASGGVSAIPDTSDKSISLDYTVKNLFSSRDYSSMGVGLSDSDTSKISRLRFRSRIKGAAALVYDPRAQLDFRESSAGVDQIIFKPSLRLRYRVGKKTDLEADLAIEVSDLDLPDFDQQTAYSLYLGYAYFF